MFNKNIFLILFRYVAQNPPFVVGKKLRCLVVVINYVDLLLKDNNDNDLLEENQDVGWLQ